MKNNSVKPVKFKDMNTISPVTNMVLVVMFTILCAVFILPVLLVVSISLSSSKSIAFNGYQFIPEEWSLEAYKYLFEIGDNLWRSYGMTIFYTAAGTGLSLLVMSMFAYVLSRKSFRWRQPLAFFTFFTTLFGGGMVSAYILYTRYLHIDDTIWVFLLPGLVSAFDVIILRTFMNTTIPDSLVESAKLDGANDFQIYCKIVMPLSKAGLASVGLFGMVSRWNDWFTGMMYINDRKLVPVMTFLQRIQKTLDYFTKGSDASNTVDGMAAIANLPSESARMAITIVVILPLLIAYPFFQKYFVKGLTVGSVKG